MRALARLFPLALFPLLAGCFLVASTDEFQEDEGCGLDLNLRNFGAHMMHEVEVRAVQPPLGASDGTPPNLLALAIFDPLVVSNIDIAIPGAVSALGDVDQERARLDFYADTNGDREITFGDDHSWRINDVCDPDRDPVFLHTLNFDPVEPYLTLEADLIVDLCPNLGSEERLDITPVASTDPIEVRIYGDNLPTADGLDEERRPVGFYRAGSLMYATNVRSGALVLRGVADTGFDYTVEVYADANGNGAFDSGEAAWAYGFVSSSVTECPPLTEICRISPGALSGVPVCRDPEGDLRVRLSRAHVSNSVLTLTDSRWFSFIEGS